MPLLVLGQEKDTLDAASYFELAYNKSLSKNFKEAIVYYTKSINLNYEHLDWAYCNRGIVKRELGDYYGSISDSNKAIEINPKNDRAYGSRGNSKKRLENYAGAILDHSKAISINPKDGTHYANRAGAKYDSGDKKGACLDWSKSGELGFMDAYDEIKEFCK